MFFYLCKLGIHYYDKNSFFGERKIRPCARDAHGTWIYGIWFQPEEHYCLRCDKGKAINSYDWRA